MKDPQLVALWSAIVCVVAVLCGAGGGLLSWLEGRSVPRALLTAGGVAGGTLALALAAATVLLQSH